MPYSRTIVTVLGFALAGFTAFTDFDETPADATSSGAHPSAPAPPAPPATILGVAYGEAGAGTQLFEFDSSGPGPARVVAEVPEGEILDVERAPDGTVFYAFVIGDTYEIRRLGPPAAGDEVVAAGWAPAVSPDGRRLAYAYYPDDAGPSGRGGIAVLELTIGAVQRFPGCEVAPGPDGCPESEGMISTISWAPDSRRLVYEAGAADPRILDTATDRRLVDSESLGQSQAWYQPAWLADGRIAVAEPDPATGVRILAVDPDTRQATEFAPANWMVGSANGIDADASGRNLLVSLDGTGHAPVLLKLTEGAPPEEIDHGYERAVW